MKIKTYIQAIVVVLCLCSGQIVAQTGVYINNPNINAVLDLTGVKKGFLAPQVSLAQANSPVPLATGGNLVYGTWVYNINTDMTGNGLSGKGYYYWDSTGVGTGKWTIVYSATTPSVYWSLIGNTGIDTSINFLGTTDDKDLRFKRNKVSSGVIGAANTGFGYQALQLNTTGIENTAIGITALGANKTGSKNTAAGFNALASNVSSNSNTAVGSLALPRVTGNGFNTGIGYLVMSYTTTGGWNAAFGSSALWANTSGHYNTAFGVNALSANTTGMGHVAFGYSALQKNITGSASVAIGVYTGDTVVTSNKNIIIGTERTSIISGSNISASSGTASYEMNIGNTLFGTSVDSVMGVGRIGINTNTPRSTLEINGSVSLKLTTVSNASYTVAADDYFIRVDGTGVQTITLPSAVSSPGRVLVCRYTGASWASGNMTITTNGTDKLVGFLQQVAAAGTFVNSEMTLKMISDGVNWYWVNDL